MPNRRIQSGGFTLVELLVVIGVVGLLIAILLPILSGVRRDAKRIACRAQLHDIGKLFNMYLNDSRGKLPLVNPIPSFNPRLKGLPAPELLAPYAREVTAGWRCGEDQIRRQIEGTPEGFETYFEREGMSYFYNSQLNLYAFAPINDHPLYRAGKQNQLRIFNDFEPFHGRAGTGGSCNYLFADWHVGDLAYE